MLSFSFFKIDSKAKQAMKSSPKVHRNYEKKKKKSWNWASGILSKLIII